VVAAVYEALRVQAAHRRRQLQAVLPGVIRPSGLYPSGRGSIAGTDTGPDAGTDAGPDAGKLPDIKVALLGYPYLVFDDHLNLGLFRKLRSLDPLCQ
jgi:hypothetical protein